MSGTGGTGPILPTHIDQNNTSTERPSPSSLPTPPPLRLNTSFSGRTPIGDQPNTAGTRSGRAQPGGSGQTPTSPRRRAHTVAVSLRPRSGSNATPRTARFAQPENNNLEPDDEEANLRGIQEEEGTDTRRKRGNSVVDRFRNSISSGTRNRSGSGTSGPVGYEMISRKGSREDSRQDAGDGESGEHEELGDEIVGVLDCIDPEVSTMNHLQNVTNSIFIPHLPALWSRRPEIRIGNDEPDPESVQRDQKDRQAGPSTSTSTQHRQRASTVAGLYRPAALPRSSFRAPSSQPLTATAPTLPSPDRPPSPTDSLKTPPDHSLDLHVRQVLRETKRQKIKKGLRGLGVFLKTPMGVATAIYGVLVVFWGAAIIFFLAGWIPVANKWWQDRWVEISSQIVNGLFTITGVGLIPWRVIDTYRMSVIWTLREKVHRLRKKQGLPPVPDPNDLEDPDEQEDYVSVLSEKDRARLKYQQEMFAKSQTWYRPHATATHRAFPMSWALWNTILMDLNSAFQCMLCGTMWGLSQYERPAWTTGCLIPLSFLCGIGAAILIWQGSARTKKRITVEERLRQALAVPLAIAVPRSKDGTILTGNNKGDYRRHSTESGSESVHGKDAQAHVRDTVPYHAEEKKVEAEARKDAENGLIPLGKVVTPPNRRATVTIGHVEGLKREDTEERARTVSNPEKRIMGLEAGEGNGVISELDRIRSGQVKL